MKRHMKRETIIGLVCLAISLTLTQFAPMLTFMSGALLGCALLLITIGFLPEKTYDSLKNWKRRLFHRTGV